MGGVQHPDSLILLEALGPCPWQDTGVREVSPGMLMAVLLRQVWKLPAREGGGAPMILLAMFTMYCSIFQQEAVQPPYHTHTHTQWCPGRRNT